LSSGERQLLQQSRREKHPDPTASVAWRLPGLRSLPPSPAGEGGGEGAGGAAAAEGSAAAAEERGGEPAAAVHAVAVDSNELKIQRTRSRNREEVTYLLTTEIPNDPDHVATPISGNARVPVSIPWEDAYADVAGADYQESNDQYDFNAEYDSGAAGYGADGAGELSPPSETEAGAEAEADSESDEADPLAGLLEILPASVTVRTKCL
jgi:hypothetical protein